MTDAEICSLIRVEVGGNDSQCTFFRCLAIDGSRKDSSRQEGFGAISRGAGVAQNDGMEIPKSD